MAGAVFFIDSAPVYLYIPTTSRYLLIQNAASCFVCFLQFKDTFNQFWIGNK